MTPLAGLILAGGKSTRFGEDKASAVLAGKPMLQWVVSRLEGVCLSIVVVRAAGQVLPHIDCAIPIESVEDLYEGKGPLAGLVAGLGTVGDGLCFATSCDAPLLRPELVVHIASLAEGYDIVCPHAGGFPQPLSAVYRAETCLPVFRESVERDVLKITAAFASLRVRIVREPELRAMDPDLRSFRNANRPDVAAGIEALLRDEIR
jgi:molybdopterin-guanine dinucleotide biosynthesis protein A